MRIVYSIILLVLIVSNSFSQDLNNLRSKTFHSPGDSIVLDTLSILPESIKILSAGKPLSSDKYRFNITNSTIHFLDTGLQHLEISYRTLPEFLNKEYFKKDINKAILAKEGSGTFYKYETGEKRIYNLDKDLLEKRGSISRGLSMGNNQDAVVNSSLNLQLSGRLTNDFQIQAAITDENLPIQPDGNSQQIQDFDKVFINVYNDRTRLQMGDFEIEHQQDHFFKLYKKAQGAMFSTTMDVGQKEQKLSTSISGAISKGKYNRMTFNGTEGNQGPYKLAGAQNESYIIVLAGSEKVYIDGQLLTRGEDKDYIIDYNTSELSFTANRLITQNLRIVIEFEYSDKNYARYLLYNQNTLQGKNGSLRISLYNEQDIKTQPLQQDLSEQQINTLQDIGDNIEQAYTSNIDSVGFQNDRVLYRKTDTIINGTLYKPVYVYSNNPNEAIYSLGFTFVGDGFGNYTTIQTDANGKVYQWSAPDTDGNKTGNYEPIILMVTPRKKQILALGGDYHFTEKLSSTFEFSLSNNDINTYSEKDKNDNVGYAIKLNTKRKILGRDSIRGLASIDYQLINSYFDPADRFRSVEFERDWNLQETETQADEHHITGSFDISKSTKKQARYQFELLNRPGNINAYRNTLNTNAQFGQTIIAANGSYLFSNNSINETGFLRHQVDIKQNLKRITLGLREESEQNRWTSLSTDSLLANSYNFNNFEIYLQSPDTMQSSFFASYAWRSDELPFENALIQSSTSKDLKAGATILFNQRNKLSTVFTYRKLTFNKNFTNLEAKDEDNFNGRINWSMVLLKGAIRSNTFYEIGSGLELIKEYQFLKVTAGQGQFIWNDYNSDGITQLDEFETAIYQDTANYIRLFVPGSNYEKVLTNQFSQNLNISLAKLLKKQTKLNKTLKRFSNTSNFRINGKNNNISISENLNPFYSSYQSENLRSLNATLRNIFSFNKGNPKYGVDHIYSKVENKSLLTNGIDARAHQFNSIKLRWRVISKLILNSMIEEGSKQFSSEFFSTKNYSIAYGKAEASLVYQPSIDIEITSRLTATDKVNSLSTENSTELKYSAEANLKLLQKGTALLRLSYIDISYNAEDLNTSIAYEMLGGLKPGDNFTWELQYQQNVTENMQLNISYFGRKSASSRALHTGNVQLRAFF